MGRSLAVFALAFAAGVAGVLAVGAAGAGRGPLVPWVEARAGENRAPEPPRYATVLARPDQRVHIRLGKPPRAALLFDIDTGRVLWRRRSTRALPIASVTKMMTALVVAERTRPGERVYISRRATQFRGSGVGLLPRGKRVKLEILLYGLMLPSGNDAATALAEHVGGSVPRFVALMNARARELGLRCTRFAAPDGYVDEGNHSCPVDLALLARKVLEQPRLARIVRDDYAVFRFPVKGGKLHLATHNPLLLDGYRGATGIKTGWTPAAGRCFVGTAQRGRVRLGVVLLGSPDPGLQARRLLDAGFRAMRPSRPAPAVARAT